jgi:hypothetical protein
LPWLVFDFFFSIHWSVNISSTQMVPEDCFLIITPCYRGTKGNH